MRLLGRLIIRLNPSPRADREYIQQGEANRHAGRPVGYARNHPVESPLEFTVGECPGAPAIYAGLERKAGKVRML